MTYHIGDTVRLANNAVTRISAGGRVLGVPVDLETGASTFNPDIYSIVDLLDRPDVGAMRAYDYASYRTGGKQVTLA